MSDKIENVDYVVCEICGEQVETAIVEHLKKKHAKVSIDQYEKDYPDAKLVPEKVYLEQKRQQRLEMMKSLKEEYSSEIKPKVAGLYNVMRLSDVFIVDDPSLLMTKEITNAQGDVVKPARDIVTEVLEYWPHEEETIKMVPDINPNYFWDEETLRELNVAMRLGTNTYIYGMHGVGKSDGVEQFCASTNRALMRVQHTGTTEESHIVGQLLLKDGETKFEPGPLVLAMMNGWVYLADEYDYAQPHIIAVYQAVLEGKPLVIKDAPLEYRIIKPHPNFRFFATGNTNGTGDSTGLYSGTKVQNAAAYSRFGTVIEMKYIKPEKEKRSLIQRVGISEQTAEQLVKFANNARNSARNGSISMPISTRELISVAIQGHSMADFTRAVNLGYINRLPIDEQDGMRETFKTYIKG